MAGPSFFLVGAPKCGTTSLCHYLRQHPDIFIPDQKELHFFASDLDIARYYSTTSEYMYQFASTSKSIAGEGTTWYLYSKKAAKEIQSFNATAKIIISIRRPTDLVYSLFRHRRYCGVEKSKSLAYVLEREKSYIADIRKAMSVDERYIYSGAAMYYEQVRRYLETFGSENVYMVIFDDIKQNPEDTYRGMLRFLGVSDGFRPSFRNVNKTGRVRSERLRQRLDHPPGVVKSMAYALPQRVRRKAYWALRRLNISYGPPPPLDPELRRRLDDEFRPDVESLSALIGRDLTHWFPQ